MAARRLLIGVLAVLAVATLAAALLGTPPESETAPQATDQTGDPAGRDRAHGRLTERAVSASSRRPQAIRLRLGDQLSLTVRSRTAGQVEIPALELVEDVALGAPARFDLLPSTAGVFAVRLAGSGREVARIVVRTAGPGRKPSRPR